MNRLFPVILLFAVTGLVACVDEITLGDPDVPDSGILVQGRFIPGTPGMVEAEVLELYALSNNQPKAIGGAKVVLHDDQGHTLDLISNFDGTYTRSVDRDDPLFPAATGRQYRLIVSLPNGQVYESAWETLLAPAPADSLHAEIVEREYLNADDIPVLRPTLSISLDAGLTVPGSQDRAHLRWEIDQGFKLTDLPELPAYINNPPKTCYVVRKLLAETLHIFDGAGIPADHLYRYPLVETAIDSRFSEGFYLLVYQQTIGANAYGYFEELNQLLDRKGTQFDPPAGSIRSNISSPTHPEIPVYGFFYAAQEDTLRIYTSPDAAGNPDRYCPLPPPFNPRIHPTPCDDCLIEGGAQLDKPSWWTE